MKSSEYDANSYLVDQASDTKQMALRDKNHAFIDSKNESQRFTFKGFVILMLAMIGIALLYRFSKVFLF